MFDFRYCQAESRELDAIVEARKRDSLTDNILQSGAEMGNLGKVYRGTTIKITSEPRYPPEGAKSHHSADEDGVWRGSEWSPVYTSNY